MWTIAAVVFSVVFVVAPVVIGIVRRDVHEKRERRYGIGGTQDIAMWGTLVMLLFGLLAALCWYLALVSW